MRRTEGATGRSPVPVAAGAAGAEIVFAGAASAATLVAAGMDAPIRAITEPGVTLVPAATSNSMITPSAGEGTSSATLSVSISAIVSSFFTRSPTFLLKEAIVPSATLSPITGTLTSVTAPAATGAGAALAGAGAAGGAAGLDAGAGFAAAAPAPLIRPRRAPMPTVSPAGTVMSERTPSSLADTSTETLSVSSSTSTSSFFTASPLALSQRPTVASETLSPSVGTTMSVMGRVRREGWRGSGRNVAVIDRVGRQRDTDQRCLLGLVLGKKTSRGGGARRAARIFRARIGIARL